MALTSGTTLGPYTVTASIGQGGMGVVYRAEDPRLKRQVAIKLLPAELTRDRTANQRFLQEAQAASALDHPNICTIHEIDETADGQLYLVMAYYEGETLAARVSRGPLPIEAVADIAVQVGQGLAKAHAAGIVHRDIKPANLMMTPDGTVKILDFGLAKLTGMEGVTAVGTTLGTVAYMSPEQARGEAVDARTDIWSLGVVLYEMIAGRPPFQRERGEAVFQAILRERPPPLTGLRTGVPLDLDRVVTRALSKPPDDRYQTAADLVSELRTLQHTVASGAAATVEAAVPSVAVLPFASMSADPENEFFSDGVTEEIINALGQIDDLHVAARSSAFSFKGKNPDLRDVGEKLNVGTVLEGSVRKAGDRLRITAQLVNVADGYQLWSERYDRQLEDVFAIQDEIARAIAERLEVTLKGERKSPLVTPATDDLEAYELYLKGRALLYRRGLSIPKGLKCLRQAVDRDPEYALAWAGLADGYTTLGYSGFAAPSETMPHAKEAAVRAVELDGSLAEAHGALAGALLFHDFDVDAATREFERAIELNPDDIQARAWYAMFVLSFIRGRFDEGLTHTARLVERDPLSGYAKTVHGFVLAIAGRHDEAIETSLAAIERDPESYLAHFALQFSYENAGRYAEAVATGHAALAMSGRHGWAAAMLATTYAAWGKPLDAHAVHDQLAAPASEAHVQPTSLAWSAAAAGLNDEAVKLAAKALRERDPFLIIVLKYLPPLEPLRQALRAAGTYETTLLQLGIA